MYISFLWGLYLPFYDSVCGPTLCLWTLPLCVPKEGPCCSWAEELQGHGSAFEVFLTSPGCLSVLRGNPLSTLELLSLRVDSQTRSLHFSPFLDVLSPVNSAPDCSLPIHYLLLIPSGNLPGTLASDPLFIFEQTLAPHGVSINRSPISTQVRLSGILDCLLSTLPWLVWMSHC